MNNDITYKNYKKFIFMVCSYFGCILILGVFVLLYAFGAVSFESFKISKYKVDNVFYMSYDVAQLDDSEESKAIQLGYEIFMNTPKYIGPDSETIAYTGNHLACTNCHLLGGTKPYAAPLIGIINRFPQYRGREDKIGTIEERINGCLERSLNGHVMPEKAVEMKALISYLNYLNRYAPEDGNVDGKGFVSIEIPNRAVDLDHGKKVFTTHCVECHNADGQGKKNPDGITYEYPPLWGDDSYNNGAGMNRVLTAAQFIKANMPFAVTYNKPLLTDEEAYDVAGYINQQLRPTKPNLEQDFPNRLKKPVSTPYPPYADPFPLEQHQLGPYPPIIDFYKKTHNIKKTK